MPVFHGVSFPYTLGGFVLFPHIQKYTLTLLHLACLWCLWRRGGRYAVRRGWLVACFPGWRGSQSLGAQYHLGASLYALDTTLPSWIHFCLFWEREGADQSGCPQGCSPNDPSLSELALLSLLTGLWVWSSQEQLLPSKWSFSSAVFLWFSFFSDQILFIFF